ncbi:NUDIX hydrolase [Amycolatopsis sp. NPDC059021]|uniref:NUDIX hydrolase n=1 Tax=Amycolatopsis sp. NPDC059021 TaxID=3346704 RepID=UPI00366A5C17
MPAQPDTVREHDIGLAPHPHQWGPGFADHRYPGDHLTALTQRPASSGPRLTILAAGFDDTAHRCLIPPGYDAPEPPCRDAVPVSRRDENIATTVDNPAPVMPGIRAWSAQRGWRVDQHGRPLHPHHVVLAAPGLGLPTGLGTSTWWGENVRVEVVLTAPGRILLTDHDTDPALLGGPSTPADYYLTHAQWKAGRRPVTWAGIEVAARRIVTTTAGIAVPSDATAVLVRAERPLTPAMTFHAWTCVYTVHLQLPRLPTATGPGVHMVTETRLRRQLMPCMHRGHRDALDAALH